MLRSFSITRTSFVAASVLCFLLCLAVAQTKTPWTDQEKPIVDQINTLRKLDDKIRAQTTKDLAMKIRLLPSGPHKLAIASGLAGLSTEGDFGKETLQEVTTTLAMALKEYPPKPAKDGGPNGHFVELASLVRYEHMQAESDNPQYMQAMMQLEKADSARQNADFTLTDIEGESWHLQDLHDKVVLVNFWATWCPPCRKEMPDLQALFEKYKGKGLIILAISDEEEAKVKPFIQAQGITYPVMLDPGRKVNQLFQVEGIPKSFVYDRDGKLVAQSIDMRTRGQFEGMLAAAGLK